MNSLPQRQAQAIEQLNALPTWYDRYNHLIKLANTLPPMPAGLLLSKNRVGGCQSVTYIATEVREGKFYLHGQSNAHIPKGIIAFAHGIFNGCTLEELKATAVNFHTQTGLATELTAGRQNFLLNLVNRICNAK